MADVQTANWCDPVALITPELKQEYESDGVILLRQALHPEWLMLIEMGLQRILGDAAVAKHRFFNGEPGEFVETVRNFDAALEIQRLMYDSPIADILGACMGSENVWYYSDEFFVKESGGCARTPWHQDTTYFPVQGGQISSMWVTLDPLPKEECLEFVRGSHRQTMYDGFDPSRPGDRSARYYGEGLPPLPDIEAEREKWDIVSWALKPGDVIVSHPGVLHGGGPTLRDGRRRALAIRCYGDDIVFATRPASMPTVPLTPGLSQHLQPGDPLRSPWYPQLRPVPAGQRYGG